MVVGRHLQRPLLVGRLGGSHMSCSIDCQHWPYCGCQGRSLAEPSKIVCLHGGDKPMPRDIEDYSRFATVRELSDIKHDINAKIAKLSGVVVLVAVGVFALALVSLLT